MGLLKILNLLLSKVLIIPVRLYQLILSPILGNNCRFSPSCSHYMIAAIEEWGPIKGLYLGLKRIVRCHPWGRQGHDPIPKRNDAHGEEI